MIVLGVVAQPYCAFVPPPITWLQLPAQHSSSENSNTTQSLTWKAAAAADGLAHLDTALPTG